MSALLIAAAVVLAAGAGIAVNHRLKLQDEDRLLTPLGQMVEVDGHEMSVYVEGDADAPALVFMAGGGTCSPILDFRSLYTLLSDDYRIAVVEKFGYGFSDVVDTDRSIDAVLEDTRAALAAAGLRPPYVLFPHSMSGLEALYWAQTYPEEVSAIIGLDMAVPAYYESMDINIPMLRATGWASAMGITRLIPGVSDGEAVRHGTLSDEEKAIYRALFFRRTATEPMIREAEQVRENARKVGGGSTPQLPMLLFVSDGSGGTGFDTQAWRAIPQEYIAPVADAKYVELDCPHYVHDHEYRAIAARIKAFLSERSSQEPASR